MPRKEYMRRMRATHMLAHLAAAVALVTVHGAWITLHPEPDPAQAQVATQVMYYLDVGLSQEDNASSLNRVTLSSGRADLKIELAGNIPIDTAALAATPDGTRLYMVDLDTANFGYYDVTNGVWSGIQGTIRTPGGTAISPALAAFSPTGELYMVNGGDEKLRVVNLTCPSTDCGKATPVGTLVEKNSKKALNIEGADIVFDGSTLYAWANRGNTVDAPRGLYKVDSVIATNGNVEASYVGGASTCPRLFSGSTVIQGVTGMTLDSTSDNLVVSCFNNGTPNQPGRMLQVSKTDGSEIASFTMRRTNLDVNFDEHGGDMTTALDVDRPAISATNLTLLDGGGAEGLSRLYEVTLDAASGQAKLKILPGGIIPGDSAAVAGIPSLPSGDRLYYVSDGLRYYNFSTESVVMIGPILSGATEVTNTAQAAFSPTDQLYIGGDAGTIKNALFRVEYLCGGTTDCTNAVYVGTVKRGNVTVDVSGADIVFANSTTLYLWANNGVTGAPRGLYRLTLPAQEGTIVNAEYLSTSTTNSVCSSDAYISGLALDSAGNLLAACVTNSTTTADQIFTISTTNGAVVEGSRFKMHLSGFPGRIYVHAGGDLTGAPGDSPVPPVAQSQSVSTAQNTDKQITLQATDVDSSSLTFAIASASGPSYGTLSAIDPPVCTTADGTTTCAATVTYSPNDGFTGNDSFAFTATDTPTNLSSTAPVSISVTAEANVPPVATDQSAVTDEDTPITITFSGSDSDSASLTFVIVSGPVNGTLGAIDAPSCTTDNGTTACTASVLYSPAANFNGVDSFTYAARDDLDTSNVATVTITVNPVNDPPVANDDMAETDENGSVIVDVLANDEDVDGDPLSATIAAAPANGTAIVNSDNTVTYTPDPYFAGQDTFTYVVTDGQVSSAPATVTIAVHEVNDPPAAVDDAYSTAEDTELVVGAPGVLSNDTDDGGTLLAALLDEPANGTLTLNADGSFSYMPNLNFNGTDSFTYQASDGTASSGLTAVIITVTPVNDAPLADNVAVSTDEDVPVAIILTGTDVETPAANLTFTIVNGPVNGTLSGSVPNLIYTPNPNYSGSDSFKFTVTDTGDGSSPPLTSAPGTVTITVSPVYDPPVAVDDSYTTDEDTVLTIVAPGVLANDLDEDGGALSASLATGPAHGTLTLGLDGGFNYTPDADYHGADGFTYSLNDGQGGTATATVQITVNPVNDAPTVSAGGPYTVDEGSSVTLNASGGDIDGDALFYEWDLDNDGSFDDAANQSVTFSAATIDGPASRTVAVRVTDGELTAISEALVTINNVAPTVTIDGAPNSSTEGTAINLTSTVSDPATADTHSYAWSVSKDAQPFATGAGLTFSFTPDDNGSYTVSLTVTDDDGGTDTDQRTITVDNVAPTASFTTAAGTINEGESATVTLADQLDASEVDQLAGFSYAYDCTDDGTFEIVGSTAETYTCQYLDNGVFTVRGRITDKDGGYSDYMVDVTVLNVTPTVGAITAPLDPQQINTVITASATFTDPGTLDTHTAIWDWSDGSTSSGTVTESNGSGSVSDSHSYATPGVYRVKLTVTDDDEGSAESIFEYVVVYNPDGGFVTGGGWINSPVGAYTADPSLTGKANFGFVAKYKKGATVPEGNTEFQFKAGDLNFHSSNYQWLVVAGAKAQFKGTGTINGQGSYGFMLTAIDGQISGGGSSDKFRIKIWEIIDGVDGAVVYDNQSGVADDADPVSVLGGGSIVIHK